MRQSDPRDACDDVHRQRIQAELLDAFGVTFAFWSDGDNGWSMHTPDESGWDADLVDAIHTRLTAMAGPQVSLVDLDSTSQLLTLPVPSQGPSPCVATAVLHDADAVSVLRGGDLFCRYLEQLQLADRLKAENAALHLQQACGDVQELALLRRLVEHVGGASCDAHCKHNGEQLLPLLNEFVSTEGIGFVPVDETQQQSPDLQRLRWFTTSAVRVEDARRLIEYYHVEAAESAVSRSLFQDSLEGVDFPGIREFALLPVRHTDRLTGWLIAVNCVQEAMDGELPKLAFDDAEMTLLRTAGSVLALQVRHESRVHAQEELLKDLVGTLVSALEAKDVYSRGHSRRVAAMSERIAERMGMPPHACKQMYLTGLLHDVGKIGLDDSTLAKPGRLTPQEFAEVKRIPQSGWAILHSLQSLGFVLPGVLHHREHYDGSGYPDGLRGEAIPLEARIVGIADAYDAMASDRPYREGMSHDEVAAVLAEDSGKQWDPAMVALLLQMTDDLDELREDRAGRLVTV